jgi:hypothetical protein
MESEISLPCTQELAARPDPELHESIPHDNNIPFLEDSLDHYTLIYL